MKIKKKKKKKIGKKLIGSELVALICLYKEENTCHPQS